MSFESSPKITACLSQDSFPYDTRPVSLTIVVLLIKGTVTRFCAHIFSLLKFVVLLAYKSKYFELTQPPPSTVENSLWLRHAIPEFVL